MKRLYFLACAGLATANQLAFKPYPISNPSCPINPTSAQGPCGDFTYKWCETPEGSDCDGCASPGSAALTDPPGFFEALRVEEVVSAEEYLLYKMLEVEYLVEFSKNPMPFQKPIDLPYCGLASGVQNLEKRKKKSWWSKIPGGSIIEATANELKGAAKQIEKGIASIDIPFLEKPPKYVPRPLCVPKTIQVPIHFTVFTTNVTTSRIVTPEILEQQLALTNEAFEPLGISFFFATVNYHVGEEFRTFTQHLMADNPKSTAAYQARAERIKQQNRYGGNDEVNIWIVESIDTPTCAKRTDGYCTPASWLRQTNHPADGCVIEIDSLPGVAWRFEGGTGSTLTHEIGHWFNLWHIFPDKEGAECAGPSDGIADTFQFPNSVPEMFDRFQLQCCSSGTGRRTTWDFCPANETIHVANYMSYSQDKGVIVETDPDETKPWTTMQRASMFTAFFTMRRAPPSGGLDPSCLNQHIVFDVPPAAPVFLNRRAGLEGRSLRGLNLFRPSDQIMKTLERVCASPPGPNNAEQAIDVISGEEIRCNAATGTCDPPSTGASCPDSSPPPCNLEAEACPEGVLPPCPSDIPSCPDGTAPPCAPLPFICPNGTSLQCLPNNNSPDPDNNTPPRPPATEPDPNRNAPSNCPSACNPLGPQTCDPTTAPTCIFPDPRLLNPRSFCACRPGYKASSSPQADTSKQWRLSIVGQEHRVWVPEGVACDQLCRDGSCGEVGVVDIGCAGGGDGGDGSEDRL